MAFVAFLLLSRFISGVGDASTSASVTYYRPVFNASGDSLAYFKRTAAFSRPSSAGFFTSAYEFERDRIALCRSLTSGAGESCLASWPLPNAKEHNGSGVIDARLDWTTNPLQFELRLQGFQWSEPAPPDGGDGSVVIEEPLAVPHLIRGMVAGRRVMATPPHPDGAAMQGHAKPALNEMSHGPTTVEGQRVSAFPNFNRKRSLLSNRIGIKQHVAALPRRQIREPAMRQGSHQDETMLPLLEMILGVDAEKTASAPAPPADSVTSEGGLLRAP